MAFFGFGKKKEQENQPVVNTPAASGEVQQPADDQEEQK